MDLGPLRTLAATLNFSAHGVPATVTRPVPDNTPVVTTGIWLQSAVDAQPVGTDLYRREPRRILALRQDTTLPTLPRGTTITAPEAAGQANKTWRVDGFDRVEADLFRAIVVLD